jgi:hypothetical protein
MAKNHSLPLLHIRPNVNFPCEGAAVLRMEVPIRFGNLQYGGRGKTFISDAEAD